MSTKMKKVSNSSGVKKSAPTYKTKVAKHAAPPAKPVKKAVKAPSAAAPKAKASAKIKPVSKTPVAKPSKMKVAAKPTKTPPISSSKASVYKAPKASAVRAPEKIKASVKKDSPLKTSEKAKSKKKVKSKKSESNRPVVRIIERKTPAVPVRVVPIKISKEMLEIRARLQTMLGEMRRDIDHEVRGASERDLAHINDTSDMASDAAEGDLALRIAESETVEAEEIERAIEKIDNGTYGTCEMCNKPIGVERLKFLPYVTLCIKCQELAEIRRHEEGDELDDLAEGAETDNDA